MNDIARGQKERRERLLGLLVPLLALAAYVPALGGDFVWDDRLLLDSPAVRSLQPLTEYFFVPFWQSSEGHDLQATYYRPLATLSLALDRFVHGSNPVGFHLTNSVLHAANSLLVFFLSKMWSGRGLPAFFAALFFAWFPRLSEAVAWISGRTDLLACFFALLALLSSRSSSWRRRWLPPSFVLLALLSKEVGIAASLGLIVFEWFEAKGTKLRQRLVQVAPALSALLVYLGLRASVLGSGVTTTSITMSKRLLTGLEAVGRNAFMILDGWHPQLQIGFVGTLEHEFVALGGLIVVLLPLAIRRLELRRKELGLFITAVTAIGLVLHLIPYQTTVVAADRFLYLPLATLTPILTARIARFRRKELRMGAVIIIISYLPAVLHRASIWGDEIDFWVTAIQENSGHHNALSRLGLGNVLAENGLYEEALRVYEQAEPGDGRNYLLARRNMANLFAMAGEFERAFTILDHAIALHPQPALYRRLALIAASAGNRQKALDAQTKYKARSTRSRAADLAEEVSHRLKARPKLSRPAGTVKEKLARGKVLVSLDMHRVAMRELVDIAGEARVTGSQLETMLSFALEYGRPDQVAQIYRRLRQLKPGHEPGLSHLVTERLHRGKRLKRLVADHTALSFVRWPPRTHLVRGEKCRFVARPFRMSLTRCAEIRSRLIRPFRQFSRCAP